MGETRQRKTDNKVSSRKEKIVTDKESPTENTEETSTDNKKTKKVCLLTV